MTPEQRLRRPHLTGLSNNEIWHRLTNNFNSRLRLLLAAHTRVDAAVLWYGVSDAQLQDRAPLFYLVLVSVLEQISSEPPFPLDARFRDLTAQRDVASFLDLYIF